MSRKSRKHAVKRKPGAGGASRAKSPGISTGRGRAVVGVCVALFLAVLLVFGRSIWFDFVDFDDPGNVSENPFVNKGLSMAGILWAFTHTQVSNWIPLTTISHMLDCQLFGLWAGGHHLTSVLLHAVTSVLLFLVLRRMTGSFWRCAFVAALFALHPFRAESVAWISERKDLLSGLFFMLTLGAYTRWTRQPDGNRTWVMVFLALGLLCKAMLITTPLVLLLLDYWPLQRTGRIRLSRLVIEKIPLIVLSVAAAAGQLLASSQAMETLDSYPIAPRIANAVVSCAAYIVQMFWPANLAAFYPFPRHGVGAPVLIAASGLLVAVSVAAFRWRRQAPWLAVGWLLYLIMLAPVIGLIQVGEVSRADRYTYLPQIGLYLIAAWTAGNWCGGHQKRRVLAGTVAAVLLLAASVLAFRQTGFWKDSETMWQRALACTSNNDTAHYNLGTSRLQKGRLDEAIAHYRKTLEANPKYADAHINLGRAFLQKGMPDEAIAFYEKALDIKPRFAEAHYNLGIVLMQKQQMDEAIAHYRKALDINPAYFDAQNNLGSAFLQTGRIDEAIVHYEEALRIDSQSAKAHNNLATALVQEGRMAQAVTHYQKVLEIDPDHIKAHNSLAWLLATSPEPAIRHGARAVELAHRANQLSGENNPLILRTLAAARAETGRFEDALQSAQRALNLAEAQGNDPLARALRGDIELYKGRKTRSMTGRVRGEAP